MRAEQAIFTSIRTPMGEGYRLVAMSPGITVEERGEITRRSPSHGSLCDPDPSAEALASYPLATQRQCVAWTRYAGKEHTARGGQRVHTHLVVLEPEYFQAFACDPFRVQAAMFDCLGPEPDVRPNTCLEPLDLIDATQWPGSIEASLLEAACVLAGTMVGNAVVLTFGKHAPLEVARWAVAALPLACRTTLAFSANLQYTSSRSMQVTCVERDGPELRRAIHGHDVQVLDLNTPPTGQGCPLDGWLGLLRTRSTQERLAEMCELACQIEPPLDLVWIDRFVEVCRDADRVRGATQPVLEALVTRYAQLMPVHAAEGRLVRKLLSNAVRRAADLQGTAPGLVQAGSAG